MIKADEVGQTAAVSPLLIDPPVAGRFVWLSKQSGTFVPEGVLPLGTKFKFSLRGAVKDAANRPVRATILGTAATPPMRVKGSAAVGYIDRDNATVFPRFLVLFNANVDAATATKYCRYVNAAGTRVAARVEQAGDPKIRDRAFPVYQSDDRSLAIWGEKPQGLPVASEEEEGGGGDGVTAPSEALAKPAPPRGNVLYIAPEKPLTPGTNWRLVFDAGLPAADGGVKLRHRERNRSRHRATVSSHEFEGRKQSHRWPPSCSRIEQSPPGTNDAGRVRPVVHPFARAA